MASYKAVQLRHQIEAFLGRGLTIRQVSKVEEMIINFKPDVPFLYLESLSKILNKDRVSMRNWGIIYYPLYALAQAFPGYTRRNNLLFLQGRLHRIYQQCDLLAGDGFGEKDLSTILFLASDCTDNEIRATFTIAQTYGLRNLRHLRGIILKNRACAIQPHLQSLGLDKDEKLMTEIEQWARSKYPDVGSLRSLYEPRIQGTLKGKHKLKFNWDGLNEDQEEESGQSYTVRA